MVLLAMPSILSIPSPYLTALPYQIVLILLTKILVVLSACLPLVFKEPLALLVLQAVQLVPSLLLPLLLVLVPYVLATTT
jgi:hypothetical protein